MEENLKDRHSSEFSTSSTFYSKKENTHARVKFYEQSLRINSVIYTTAILVPKLLDHIVQIANWRASHLL